MPITTTGGTQAQKTLVDSVYADLKYPMEALKAHITVGFSPHPSEGFHNLYAVTTHANPNHQITMRDDLGPADTDLFYDILAHELGHVAVVELGLAEPAVRAVFTAAPADAPYLATPDNNWADCVSEANVETFKDVFSPRRKWDNRTKWRLTPDKLPDWLKLWGKTGATSRAEYARLNDGGDGDWGAFRSAYYPDADWVARGDLTVTSVDTGEHTAAPFHERMWAIRIDEALAAVWAETASGTVTYATIQGFWRYTGPDIAVGDPRLHDPDHLVQTGFMEALAGAQAVMGDGTQPTDYEPVNLGPPYGHDLVNNAPYFPNWLLSPDRTVAAAYPKHYRTVGGLFETPFDGGPENSHLNHGDISRGGALASPANESSFSFGMRMGSVQFFEVDPLLGDYVDNGGKVFFFDAPPANAYLLTSVWARDYDGPDVADFEFFATIEYHVVGKDAVDPTGQLPYEALDTTGGSGGVI